MKKVTIYKGFHRPLTFIPACFRHISRIRSDKKQIIAKTITFTDSCRYYLTGNDQHDWNKLFGICFGWNGIHKNSARFVWRYNPGTDRIEITTYYYIDGQRVFENPFTLQINEPVKLVIEREDNKLWFYINDEFFDYIEFETQCKFTFGCGLYFGGNRRAPQDITILK